MFEGAFSFCRSRARWFARALAFVLLVACSLDAGAQAISRYARFTGNLNFVATGGSLRVQSDSVNACSVNNNSSQLLTGIPNGSSIVAAYLYWAGSGSNADPNVRLNNRNVVADRQFSATYVTDGTSYRYFGGFADVTDRITGNGTVTFSQLSVATGAPYCASNAVLAGWALVVIYGSPNERLRAINVFDGLQYFRGSSITLTPDGFRIPAQGKDGRMAVITWEGDPGNSEPLNNVSEQLRFNGALLDDGLIPSGSQPSVQQFDGTVNSVGAMNTYGVDVDTYDVSSHLSPGQTSATTLYSAGADLVLLAAQVVSVTSEPIVDLSVTATHAGSFRVGTNGTYTITVASQPGWQATDYPIVVTDTLPAGLTFVSSAGTGWSCSSAGQIVTCAHAGPLASGASLPPLSLTVAVGAAAAPAVTNTVQVETASYDPDPSNNTASDPTTVIGPDLSTSTMTVIDLNGGDVEPGDTLRYTITLVESAGVAVSGASVIDHIAANLAGFSASSITIPSGATNASTYGGTGASGKGLLNVTGIDIPASGSATITFDVQVAAGLTPGATIDNSATVNNPTGPGAEPSAPQLIVSESQIPGAGTKPLYLWSNPVRLSRQPPIGSHGNVILNPNGDSETWTMTPVLQTPLTLQPGPFAVRLWLARSDGLLPLSSARQFTIALVNSSLGTIASLNNDIQLQTSPSLLNFTLNVPAAVTAPAGSTFSLVITNNSSTGFLTTPRLNVYPVNNGQYSRVELQSATVINVDAVQTYDAPYPAGTLTTTFARGATVYVRATVSDPFGSFDITGADLTIVDPNANALAPAAMNAKTESGALKTYEYAFAIPANAASGAWTLRVVAREGTEGQVTDLGIGSFVVGMPAISIEKISQVLSDPVNGTSNPKRIPGSVVRYTITVTNTGDGAVDAGSLVVHDLIPPDLSLYVDDTNGDPIEFEDGPTPSGLIFDSSTDVRYSIQPGGGDPFGYTPSPGPDGFDPAITAIRIAPGGSMAGATSLPPPSFKVHYRVRVN